MTHAKTRTFPISFSGCEQQITLVDPKPSVRFDGIKVARLVFVDLRVMILAICETGLRALTRRQTFCRRCHAKVTTTILMILGVLSFATS